MIHTIKNKCLSLSFNLHGGSMCSIKDVTTGEELQYQPDPRSWSGQDVVIFPFVARLKGGKYTVDGKEYSMKNHGLCRYNDFEVVELKDDEATIRFSSNEETLKEYPYNFIFEVNYKLEGKSVKVSYTAKNTNDVMMPFGIGGHPALKVNATEKEDETDISGTTMHFDSPTELTQMVLDESGSFVIGEKSLGILDKLSFTKQFFHECPTLILKSNDIKHVVLEKCNGEKVSYNFDADYLALWSHPQWGDYFCVEPWASVPDYMNATSEMKEKKSLVHLDPNDSYTFSYTITF